MIRVVQSREFFCNYRSGLWPQTITCAKVVVEDGNRQWTCQVLCRVDCPLGLLTVIELASRKGGREGSRGRGTQRDRVSEGQTSEKGYGEEVCWFILMME